MGAQAFQLSAVFLGTAPVSLPFWDEQAWVPSSPSPIPKSMEHPWNTHGTPRNTRKTQVEHPRDTPWNTPELGIEYEFYPVLGPVESTWSACEACVKHV